MLFWRGRLRVDFLPSFELISGVTHAILDEVPRMQSRRSVYPFGFFDTLRGKSATRAQSEQGRVCRAGLNPNREKDVLGRWIEPRSAFHV
jgi:hypothetical protein